MATPNKPAKKRQLKPAVSVRQRAESASAPKASKQRRLRTASARLTGRLHRSDDQKVTESSGKRPGRLVRWLIPKYFREAWHELRKVTWPGRKETAKLTFAVFMFAAFFMLFITTVDFILDKLFKQLILK